MGDFQIYFNDEAAGQYRVLASDPVVGGLARRYLEELLRFPPEAWGDLYRRHNALYFKADHHIIFDIQGRVMPDAGGMPIGLKITRFRLRNRD